MHCYQCVYLIYFLSQCNMWYICTGFPLIWGVKVVHMYVYNIIQYMVYLDLYKKWLVQLNQQCVPLTQTLHILLTKISMTVIDIVWSCTIDGFGTFEAAVSSSNMGHTWSWVCLCHSQYSSFAPKLILIWDSEGKLQEYIEFCC